MLGMLSAVRSESARSLRHVKCVKRQVLHLGFDRCSLDIFSDKKLQAVRSRHVNLVDLIEWGRRGGESVAKKVRIFRSVAEPRE